MNTSRRKVIKSIAAGAVAAPAIAWGLPALLPQRKKEKLGIALVGLGYYSTDILAPALQLSKKCQLMGIVTGTPSKIDIWQKKYGIADKNVYNYQNFDSVANNPDIDVIYVVLPPSMHRDYVERAARAGKHVWCEKPMAVTEVECAAMVKACADNKVKLSIGYRMHHEPNTQDIIRFAKEKTFGPIRLISVAAGYFDGRTNHWKQQKALGGGSMYDMGVYPLNAARYAAGEEPKAVVAQHFTNRPEIYTEVDETTVFTLEFPGGAVANCATSFGMNMSYLKVTAGKANYFLEPFQAYNEVRGAISNGTALNKTITNQQAQQMDDDATAILDNKPVMVPGEEGWKDIRIVEAIYKSAKEGRRVEL